MDQFLTTFLDWDYIWQVFPDLLKTGLLNTLILAVTSALIGTVLGMVLAVMGLSTKIWLRWPARVYTDIFRGLPDPDDPRDRPGPRHPRAERRRHQPVPAGHPGAEPDRGRLHRRDLPVRHPECRQRTAGGQPRARDELHQGDAAGDHPAGRPAGAAGTGEPVHRADQGF